MAAVRSAFKPEFINRLDDVIDLRRAATPTSWCRSSTSSCSSWHKRLAQRRLTLEVSLPAKKWLADRGFDPLYGARPLRRLIQQAIGDQLAKMLLAGEVHDGDVVPVNVSAGRRRPGPGLSALECRTLTKSREFRRRSRAVALTSRG